MTSISWTPQTHLSLAEVHPGSNDKPNQPNDKEVGERMLSSRGDHLSVVHDASHVWSRLRRWMTRAEPSQGSTYHAQQTILLRLPGAAAVVQPADCKHSPFLFPSHVIMFSPISPLALQLLNLSLLHICSVGLSQTLPDLPPLSWNTHDCSTST